MAHKRLFTPRLKLILGILIGSIFTPPVGAQEGPAADVIIPDMEAVFSEMTRMVDHTMTVHQGDLVRRARLKPGGTGAAPTIRMDNPL